MQTLRLTVRFNTPAFLGNADQNGQWRTPPFKHLLREWWRVAVAAQHDFNYRQIREAEAGIFGSAVDCEGRKSRVRMRLDCWSPGKLTRWQKDPAVNHPEVGPRGRNVGSHLYLGYGPLRYHQGSTALKANAAIQAGEENQLRLAFPPEDGKAISTALWHIDQYGAIGGRSRNGWGSLSILSDNQVVDPGLPLRNWRDCLDEEWPHAIGADDENVPLIWKTLPLDDWAQVMRELAGIKVALRTLFSFRHGSNAQSPEPRHWLSYPVTHHSVRGWGNKRLPNSLRFKVRRDENGRLYGVIFHMPCRPPADFHPDRDRLIQVWSKVHRFLDGQNTLERSPS